MSNRTGDIVIRRHPVKITGLPQFSCIKGVGVELEGAWARQKELSMLRKVGLNRNIMTKIKRSRSMPRNRKGDSSINIREDTFGSDMGFRGVEIGEVVSGILNPGKEVGRWVTRNYPDIVNETCGLHVHVSFHTKEQMRSIVKKAFVEYVLDCMEAWGKSNHINDGEFWRRLYGANSYCRRDYQGDKQLAGLVYGVDEMGVDGDGGGNRHSQFNYSAFHKFGTIEVRFLPMFVRRGFAICAIYELLTAIERYVSGAAEWVEEITAEDELEFSDINSSESYDLEVEHRPRLIEYMEV